MSSPLWEFDAPRQYDFRRDSEGVSNASAWFEGRRGTPLEGSVFRSPLSECLDADNDASSKKTKTPGFVNPRSGLHTATGGEKAVPGGSGGSENRAPPMSGEKGSAGKGKTPGTAHVKVRGAAKTPATGGRRTPKALADAPVAEASPAPGEDAERAAAAAAATAHAEAAAAAAEAAEANAAAAAQLEAEATAAAATAGAVAAAETAGKRTLATRTKANAAAAAAALARDAPTPEPAATVAPVGGPQPTHALAPAAAPAAVAPMVGGKAKAAPSAAAAVQHEPPASARRAATATAATAKKKGTAAADAAVAAAATATNGGVPAMGRKRAAAAAADDGGAPATGRKRAAGAMAAATAAGVPEPATSRKCVAAAAATAAAMSEPATGRRRGAAAAAAAAADAASTEVGASAGAGAAPPPTGGKGKGKKASAASAKKAASARKAADGAADEGGDAAAAMAAASVEAEAQPASQVLAACVNSHVFGLTTAAVHPRSAAVADAAPVVAATGGGDHAVGRELQAQAQLHAPALAPGRAAGGAAGNIVTTWGVGAIKRIWGAGAAVFGGSPARTAAAAAAAPAGPPAAAGEGGEEGRGGGGEDPLPRAPSGRATWQIAEPVPSPLKARVPKPAGGRSWVERLADAQQMGEQGEEGAQSLLPPAPAAAAPAGDAEHAVAAAPPVRCGASHQAKPAVKPATSGGVAKAMSAAVAKAAAAARRSAAAAAIVGVDAAAADGVPARTPAARLRAAARAAAGLGVPSTTGAATTVAARARSRAHAAADDDGGDAAAAGAAGPPPHTAKRARRTWGEQKDAGDGAAPSPYKPLAQRVQEEFADEALWLKVQEFESKALAHPQSMASKAQGGPHPAHAHAQHAAPAVTVAKSPLLRVNARAVRVGAAAAPRTREEREAEEMAAMPRFRAQPLDPRALLGTQPTPNRCPTDTQPTPTHTHGAAGGSRGGGGSSGAGSSHDHHAEPRPTAPQPFKFASDARIEARRAAKAARGDVDDTAQPQVAAFKAAPIPRDLLKPRGVGGSASGGAGVQKVRGSHAPHRTPLVPRSPLLRTKARAATHTQLPQHQQQQQEEGGAAGGAARRVQQQQQGARGGPTQPAPFQLATDSRGKTHEHLAAARAAAAERAERAARVPRAQGLPASLDNPIAPPKPPARSLTLPQPFQLRGESRHKEYLEGLTAEQRAEEDARRAAAQFHARALPVHVLTHPFQVRESDAPLTVPEEPRLRADARAAERAEFDRAVAERQRLSEEQRQLEDAQRAAAEEAEVRALRRGLKPVSARAVPDFSRPFMALPSAKPLTNPVSPALGAAAAEGVRKKAVRVRRTSGGSK
ncbi:hypothetical protein FOA52_008010 [Chlamydomonas sp. UWO 241]|nr:hypothetical protein FOA52_008010 [Chlamydomonas sp. UWO 241]